MKTTSPTTTGQHPRASLLPYLEDMLPQVDRSEVEAHLKDCQQCSHELREIKQTTDFLRSHKEVFCPELWELYDYCQSGHDPEGRLARHLEQCPSCRDAVTNCAGCTEDTEMPESLRDAVQRHFEPKQLHMAGGRRSWLSGLVDQISSLFRMPVLVLGTAAAAVLLVVILSPLVERQPIMRLSSVEWNLPDQALVPKGLQLMNAGPRPQTQVTKRSRVAVILFFKGLDREMTQEQVDSLYAALEPPPLVQRNFEYIAPAKIRETLGEADLKLADVPQLAGKLNKELDVSQVIIMTVGKSGDKFNIYGQAVSAQTGQSIKTQAGSEIPGAELASRLKQSSLAVLGAESANK